MSNFFYYLLFNNVTIGNILLFDQLISSLNYIIRIIFSLEYKDVYYLGFLERIFIYSVLFLGSFLLNILTWGFTSNLIYLFPLFIYPQVQNLIIEFNYSCFKKFKDLRNYYAKTILSRISSLLIRKVVKDTINESLIINDSELLNNIDNFDMIKDIVIKIVKNTLFIYLMRYLRPGLLKFSYRLAKYGYYLGSGRLVKNYEPSEAKIKIKNIVKSRNWLELIKPDSAQAILILLENQRKNSDMIQEIGDYVMLLVLKIGSINFMTSFIGIIPSIALFVLTDQVIALRELNFNVFTLMRGLVSILFGILFGNFIHFALLSELFTILVKFDIHSTIYSYVSNNYEIVVNKNYLYDALKIFITYSLLKLISATPACNLLFLISGLILFKQESIYAIPILVLNIYSLFNPYHILLLLSIPFAILSIHKKSIVKETKKNLKNIYQPNTTENIVDKEPVVIIEGNHWNLVDLDEETKKMDFIKEIEEKNKIYHISKRRSFRRNLLGFVKNNLF